VGSRGSGGSSILSLMKDKWGKPENYAVGIRKSPGKSVEARKRRKGNWDNRKTESRGRREKE